MSDALKKVQPGDPLVIPAEAYNAFIDAARDYRQRQRDLGQETAAAEPANSGVILVKNASGADRERFDVLGVQQPIFGPSDNLDTFKNRPALAGIVPTADHAGRFVILLEPLKSGLIGRATASGVSIARVDVQDEADRMADVADGVAGNLVSTASGVAQILWKEAGTGIKWAVVRIGGGGGSAQLPVGQYQFMNYTMVTQNVAGWDFARAAPASIGGAP